MNNTDIIDIEYWRVQLKKIEWSNPSIDLPSIDVLCNLAFIGLTNQWIPISTKMPPTQRMVLLATPGSQRAVVDYGFLDCATKKFMVQSTGWEPVENFGGVVSHWKPLPTPPESTQE